MVVKVLIITPLRSFGELLLQALQEVGYFPLLVADVPNALIAVHTEDISLAILDCQISAPGFENLAHVLRTQAPNIRMIYLFPDQKCRESFVIDPLLDTALPQPVYLPDLLGAVECLLPLAPDSASMPPIPAELAWLEDVNRAAQYLTRLSLEADAQAALIIRNTQLWAYAGQLPQNAAEELTYLTGEWPGGQGGDLARFVRLSATGGEYMLYVTDLGAGFVLALAYEAEMPFSKMRAQTGELARKLTSTLPDILAETQEAPDPQNSPLPVEIDQFSASDWVSEYDTSAEEAENWLADDDALAQQAAMFEALLASIDIPNPDGASRPEASRPMTVLEHQVVEQPQKSVTLPEIGEATPLAAPSASVREAPLSAPIQLEPESPALHDLVYACVLVTRLPSQAIAGDLSVLLNRAMTRLCLAYGWRLEHLAIRPQYLHWVVRVDPSVAPAEVIRKLRVQTSQLIFEEMPKLAKENPSGDFWAPGYMVVHGRQSLSGDLLRDFISQTRLHQGF